MLENSLLKTNYLGRDGYIWWIGQIAEEKYWADNIEPYPVENVKEFKGFDYRYKVRIMGYHPQDEGELSSDQLPWASVMFPVTAGSGQGGASQSPNLRQGNFVHGFFLDGEDGQQPVITGVLSVNQYAEVSRNAPKVGYDLFSGYPSVFNSLLPSYTLPLEQNAAAATRDYSFNPNNDVTLESLIGVDIFISGADLEYSVQSKEPKVREKTTTCDPNKEIPIQTILSTTLNRKQRLEKAKKKWKEKISNSLPDTGIDLAGALEGIDKLEREIDKMMANTQQDITKYIKTQTDGIQKNISQKINESMARAYSKIHPSKFSETKKLEEKAFDDLSCAFKNIQANLFKMVGNFLNQSINKLINAPLCAINNFVGSLLGKVSGIIDGAVGAILGPVKSLLSSLGGVADIVDDLTDVASTALTSLSCAATPTCSEIQAWSAGGGLVGPPPATLDIPGLIFKAKEVASGVKKSIDDFKDIGSSVKGVMDNADFSDVIGDAVQSCFVGPLRCGPPTIEFFGGGGSGAAGNAIIGAAGTLLGVDVILPGSGYSTPPLISFKDSCGKGGGATGTAVVQDGKVVDVIMNDTGTGYLTAPDGSQGGDGTTWADADETTVKKADGTYEVPYSPGEVITVCPGDEVTEPGGKVVLIGGEDCVQITAKPPSPQPDTPIDPTSNTGEYPIVLSIDKVSVIKTGFNYDCSKDKVVVEPDNGAKLSIGKCDSLGSINQINVIDGGSGFKDDPNIYIQSESGYNCKLVPTFKVTRVEEVSEVPPTGVIQVVDCVGKF